MVQGQVITTTAEHPFYVAGEERFVPAGELTLEDSLVDSQGLPVAIEAIRPTDRLITVYNLGVADFHTYFVGGKLWQFDAWVHNARYGNLSENLGNGWERRTYRITSDKTGGTYYRKLDFNTSTGKVDFSRFYLRDSNGNPVIETIALSGKRKNDFRIANMQRGVSQESDYVWHHLDFDGNTGLGRMVLVKKEVHEAVGHSGGAADYTRYHGLNTYG